MDTSPNSSDEAAAGGDPVAREGVWAKPVDRLRVSRLPEGALNLNVEGRHITGPLQGFGQLWQKTYRVPLSGAQVTPVQVIRTWLENFPQFWPKGNRFYAPRTGIQLGEVAILNLAGPGGITGPGGMPLISTGVMVIYADEESFSFMTPEGHPFAAMITFSAIEDEGATVAQIQALVRANDPLYELSLRLGLGHKSEDVFWHGTLLSLARYFGVESVVQQQTAVVDPRIQWYQAKNIWHNAAIRTGLYTVGAPLRWVRGVFNKK